MNIKIKIFLLKFHCSFKISTSENVGMKTNKNFFLQFGNISNVMNIKM